MSTVRETALQYAADKVKRYHAVENKRGGENPFWVKVSFKEVRSSAPLSGVVAVIDWKLRIAVHYVNLYTELAVYCGYEVIITPQQ